jgi:signal transduction histidine kinase
MTDAETALLIDGLREEVRSQTQEITELRTANAELARRLVASQAELAAAKARIREFDKSIDSEMRDPNGTIWEVANQFLVSAEKAEAELAALRAQIERCRVVAEEMFSAWACADKRMGVERVLKAENKFREFIASLPRQEQKKGVDLSQRCAHDVWRGDRCFQCTPPSVVEVR